MATLLKPLAGAARLLLALLAGVIVVGSFAWVLSRPLRSEGIRPGQVALRVLHWGDKNEDAIVAQLCREFEAQNPDIKIVRINLGQAAHVATKLQTMIAAGDAPEVFYLEAERVADLASKGVLQELDSFVERDRAAGAPDALDLADFFPAVLDAFRWNEAEHRVGSGALVGLGKDFTTVGFYYNKDLFDRADVPYPNPEGWTWDEFHDACRRIGALPDCYGADFVTWEVMVRIFLFTHGRDFASPGYQEFFFRDPTVIAAVEKLQGWFEEGRTLLSAKTQLETGLEPFLAGNIGLAGPFGRWKVPTYRTIDKFRWDFAPLPLAPGQPPVNAALTVAWAMGARNQHPEQSWRLMKFLLGPRGQEVVCNTGLAIPARRSIAYGPCFRSPEAPESDDVYLRAAEVARFIEWPAGQEYRTQLRIHTEEIFKLGKPAAAALAAAERDWQANRTPSTFKARYARVEWRWLTLIAGAALAAALLAGLAVWWRGRLGRLARREELVGMAMVSPWVIGFAIFTAWPVAMSLALAFTRWSALLTLDQAESVGFDNFTELFGYDTKFRRALLITAWYALLAVPTSQIAALVAALLVCPDFRGVGVFRAIWYLPSVLAGVGMAIMWKWVFHHEHGLLNLLLAPVAGWFGATPPAWFELDAETWGVPAFALLNLWVLGGTMMIYLAGLKGIPRDLYEAADIDGAVGWRKFRNVTLPMLSPVIFFNTIMALIASFQIFTQVYIMTGGGPGTATHFYVFYLYDTAFNLHQMGYASAMAWVLLLIVLALTLSIMRGSQRYVYYEALK